MPTYKTEHEHMPDYYLRPTLILGCGNRLFGDDGFGPEVAEHLERNYRIPEDVYVMDVGIGAREILFDLVLTETNVQRVLIVDAVDFSHLGRKPGEIFKISIQDLPVVKTDDFSMHQVPSSNLLRELRDHSGLDVQILVCQVGHIPEEVQPGLTGEVREVIPRMCELIIESINGATDKTMGVQKISQV